MGRQPDTDAEVHAALSLRLKALGRCGPKNGFGRVDEAWDNAREWGYEYAEFACSSFPCTICPFYLACVIEQRPVNDQPEDMA
jgi:hypothetical protein